MEEQARDAQDEALIREVLGEMRDWRRAHQRASLAAIEQEVETRLARLRAHLVERTALASASADVGALAEAARPRCPDCGQGLVERGQHERTLTIRGNQPVRLRRSYAVCPTCGVGLFPLDEELDLGPGAFSPYLVESIARLGTRMPFEQVPGDLAFFTQVTVGEDTARRLTETAGAARLRAEAAEWERGGREASPLPAGPAVQQVSVDGAMVPLVHGQWAEVKTLAIGVVGTRRDREGQEVACTREVSYLSRLADADQFIELAQLETARRGTRRAGVVCAVADGAPWIQRVWDWHCPKAVRILDFPHAAEHLSSAAHAVLGTGTAAASEWLGQQLHDLKHDDPASVLAALRTLGAQAADPAAQESCREVLGYLEARRPQLADAAFQAQGYPIGSGMVESANKLVVEARLKGAGMHWARANVNPMVALRAMTGSGRWAASWPVIWAELRRQRAARRRARHRARQPSPPPEPVRTPPATVKPTPLARLPKKGLVVDGRPTADHPFNKQPAVRHRLPPATDAKL
jgi:hypothetical protein